jgi:HPt (histidine-containing phosphotransfer) domain-containing protein
MNIYERLLSTLAKEFKQKAPPQFRSLWADLMELEEATDDLAFSTAHDHALRRIHALECAAKATQANPVQSLGRSLELELRALNYTRAASHPEYFGALRQTMNRIAEALYTGDETAPLSEKSNQPAEELVESYVD